MLTILVFFVGVFVIICIFIVPFIIPVFNMVEFDETVFLTRLMFPFLAFISLAALFQGILNCVHVFAPSGFAPIILNIIIIGCAYGLAPFAGNPARAMAYGVIIGGTLAAALQLPFVRRKGFRFSFIGLGKALGNPGARKVLWLIGPTIIGMAAYQINDLVSTALAGNAGEGVVSSLQYSLRLKELMLGVFAVSIGTVLLPALAENAKRGNWQEYNQRLGHAMDIIALITIPITFFFLAQGDSIIRLLFQTRTFDEESVALTYGAFLFHMPGLYFIALNRILAPAFYAQSDTRSPTLAGILAFAVNISLAALLVGNMKGSGIALALTIAAGANTALLLVFLGRNTNIAVKKIINPAALYAGKIILFSCIAALPVFFLTPHLILIFTGHNRLVSYGIPLIIMGFLFATIGLFLMVIGGDKQLKVVVKMLKERIGVRL